MTDDRDDAYLWEGSGEPDPDVVRFERLLGRLRHEGTAPPFPKRRHTDPPRRTLSAGRIVAMAAALIVVCGAGWLALSLRASSWTVRQLSGAPVVDGQRVSKGGRLRVGEWLVTDAASRARMGVGHIGQVDVDPDTRLQLLAARGSEHRLALARGTIHARIWAPPKFFYVNTPAATAIDLGCAYTLHVDDRGAGLLRVTHGWVGFERDGRETYIPQGAVCATRADVGPGTPRYEDAPSGFGEALDVLDFAGPADPRRAAALDLILSQSRRRDALTLWHLLTRGTLEERGRVFDRMAALAPLPRAATREAVLGGDRTALSLWWDSLDVETGTWWRLLKRKW